MNNDDVHNLVGASSVAEVLVALDGIAARPTDFVVATADHVIVGGQATATIGATTYRHTGDGTFTRHELAVTSEDMLAQAPPAPAAAPQPPTPVTPPPPVPPGNDAPVPPDKVASLGAEPVLVRGLMCQRDHLVHPDARMCPLCGDNMQNRSILVSADGSVGELGPRPPLGVVILPDGRSYQLERTTIIGRAPEMYPEVQAGTADAIRLDDSELSRAHVRFALSDWDVAVEDLASTNGTWIGTGPGARQLQANRAVPLTSGVDIFAGTSVINYQPTSAAQR